MEVPEVPEYNPKGKETINQYLRRVEKYKATILKGKYDIVLKFINELIKAEYESLSEFSNKKEYTILRNKKHNKAILEKYSSIFEEQFNVTLEEYTDEKYIIEYLIKILNVIDYALVKREFNDNIIYSIRQL